MLVVSDVLRITGMVTGMDTDQMVKQLVSLQQTKVDKLEQDKQYTQWQQDAYREIANLIRGFRDEYFDYLKPDSNFRSLATLNSYKATYNGEESSEYINVTATGQSSLANQTITSITTAQKAVAEGTSLAGTIKGVTIADLATDALNSTISSANNNNKFAITLNSTTEVITISDGLTTIQDLQADLQAKIDAAFGLNPDASKKISVSVNDADNSLSFSTADTNTLSLGEVDGNSGLESIGFAGDGVDVNTSNKISLSANLADIANDFTVDLQAADTDGDGYDIEFTINGQHFAFDSTQTSLQDIIDTVNEDEYANVTMRYDSLSDSIVVESNNTGVTAQVEAADVSGEGNLMAVFGLDGTQVNGSDAVLEFANGTTIVRSSNNFDIDGLSFELKKDYSGSLELAVETDTSGTLELIKGFVEKYNEVITKINDKVTEERDLDYRPLTDAQKEEMTEKEIELWEEKAKSGVLRNDSILQDFLYEMRAALYQEVEGAGLSLSEIGITTSKDYMDGGKLVIDEDKLSAALSEKPEQVARLFSQAGETYEEQGIAQRWYDTIQKNIRVTRDENGYKGLLLEKAGIVGDITEFDNTLSDRIEDYEERIDVLLEDLAEQEERYYNMFARMEAAIARLNSQAMWLQQQFGGQSM